MHYTEDLQMIDRGVVCQHEPRHDDVLEKDRELEHDATKMQTRSQSQWTTCNPANIDCWL